MAETSWICYFWRWWCMQDAEELFWRSLAIHVSQLSSRHPRQAHLVASTSCRRWVGTCSQFLFLQTFCLHFCTPCFFNIFSRLTPNGHEFGDFHALNRPKDNSLLTEIISECILGVFQSSMKVSTHPDIAHPRQSPVRQRWKESLCSLLVKV